MIKLPPALLIMVPDAMLLSTESTVVAIEPAAIGKPEQERHKKRQFEYHFVRQTAHSKNRLGRIPFSFRRHRIPSRKSNEQHQGLKLQLKLLEVPARKIDFYSRSEINPPAFELSSIR
jgi:hypothetical protein